jgi:hypothetical protein
VLIDGVLDDHRGVTEFAILYHPHRGARNHTHSTRPTTPLHIFRRGPSFTVPQRRPHRYLPAFFSRYVGGLSAAAIDILCPF